MLVLDYNDGSLWDDDVYMLPYSHPEYHLNDKADRIKVLTSDQDLISMQLTGYEGRVYILEFYKEKLIRISVIPTDGTSSVDDLFEDLRDPGEYFWGKMSHKEEMEVQFVLIEYWVDSAIGITLSSVKSNS